MQQSIRGKSFETLLTLYNQEIDKMKEKLLNGESWEDLQATRKNITELAIALHKSHNYIASGPGRNPAEFPQFGDTASQVVE